MKHEDRSSASGRDGCTGSRRLGSNQSKSIFASFLSPCHQRLHRFGDLCDDQHDEDDNATKDVHDDDYDDYEDATKDIDDQHDDIDNDDEDEEETRPRMVTTTPFPVKPLSQAG